MVHAYIVLGQVLDVILVMLTVPYGGPGGRERTLYTCAFHVCGFVV